jgi:Domain of unknown function (DUF4214)
MLAMETLMSSVFGWMRRRLGRLAATPAGPKKRPGRAPSTLESLERREVFSASPFSPFAALPAQVTPVVVGTSSVAPSATVATTSTITSYASIAPAAAYPASSTPTAVVSPTSIAATPTAYYYGQAIVQAPSPVQASAVAPVYYAGQPVVALSTPGATTTNLEVDYVQALYRDVLDRVGTPNEVNAWVAEMNEGETIPEVALGFVNSIEHREDEVDSFYQEFLHRTPDSLADVWANALVSGDSEETVAEAILDSNEYSADHPDNSSFVQGLYNDVLGRAADVTGYAGWEEYLEEGGSRRAVVAGIVGSAEAVDQVIENYYEAYLHRQPDLPNSTVWANVLASSNGSATTVAVGILSSPEFVQDAVQG